MSVSTPKRRFYFYSPVPPLKSGTAHYLGLLLDQLPASIDENYDVTLVIDERHYKESFNLPDLPYPVVDYRSVKRSKSDVTYYFLANNEFHRYVHKALYDHKKDNGVAVSIVHEPCMWMNVQGMCNLREYGFNEDDLQYFAQYEFGDHAEFMNDLFRRGATDANFEYTSLAATHIYENSDVIVFHSRFALQKFTLERSESYVSPRNSEPLYLVMQHPPEEALASFPESDVTKSKFVAGTYGWAQKTKQTDAIIKGFDSFYASLSSADKERVALYVVGQVQPERGFDPVAVANLAACREKVVFWGYVSDHKLNELMAESSLVFSLRFPSCGETSGPLYKANALDIPVALSDYAAFADEPAEYHIPVERAQQHDEIVRILKREFKNYKSKRGEMKRVIKKQPIEMTINQVIDTVLEHQG